MLTFRLAAADDIDAVRALVEAAYRSHGGWTTEADLFDGPRTSAEELREIATGERSRVVLAEEDGVLLGSVRVADEGDCAYVGMFAVRPLLQARGVGSALLAEAERIAREELRAPSVRLTVLVQRPDLIAWYERRGYALTGETEPFPYGEGRDERPLRGDLSFVVLRKQLSPSAAGS